MGLLHAGGNSAAVSNSVASGNGTGFLTQGGGKLELFHTVASKNRTGIKADGGLIRIAYCSVNGNGTGISASGGTIGTMGNNGRQQRYRCRRIDQCRHVSAEIAITKLVDFMKGGKMKGIKGFTLIEFVLWAAVAMGLAAIALPAVQ